MITINGKEYYDLLETTKILSKNKDYIRGLRRCNNIKFIKHTNRYYYEKENIDNFIPPRIGKPKLTIKEINNRIKKHNLKLISNNYKSVSNYGTFMCINNGCGYIREMMVISPLQQKKIRCPKCSCEYNQKDIEQNISKRNIGLLDDFNGIKSHKLKWLCKVCNKTWKAPTKHVIDNNTGCPNCSPTKKLTVENINVKLSKKNLK